MDWSHVRAVFKNIGTRTIVASMAVFLLTVALTLVGGVSLYRSTREDLELMGRMNAVQSARDFDAFLLVRKNTVLLASRVVDEMVEQGLSTSEILAYLTTQSLSIQQSIDKDYTGLYGWVAGEYLDGVGWVPEDDYVATERPWYTETIADDAEVTFVSPYLDDQTHTVLTTMAEELSDGESVIALDVPLGHIQEIAEKVAQTAPGALGVVLDKAGRVIAHSDRAELGKDYGSESGTLGAELAAHLRAGDPSQFSLEFGDKRYVAFVERIEGDWRAISLIDTDTFYQPLRLFLPLVVFVTVLEAAVFVTVIYNQSERNLAIASAREAQSANHAKTVFLSQMSHEIRTPINAIIGLDTIMLRDDDISPRTRESLEKIGASARHLLSLINDILDMSRIDSGHIELKEEQFSFQKLLAEVNAFVGGQCEDKGLTYVCQVEGQVDDAFVGDALKLKQAMINVLGNSVKFTEAPGTVSLTVSQETVSDERAMLRLAMADTGIGIDEDFLPHLFDAFSMQDTANTSRYGGSGLGLAITQRIVENMDGEISVESVKGEGTCFNVCVSLARVEAPAAIEDAQTTGDEETEPRAPSVEGCHVLIVEDQELNADILCDLLDLEDVSSEWAENGQLAVEAFAGSEPGHFDAILMDMRMPVMDGLAATRAIRDLERPDARTIPIIALTANAFEEDVQHCLEAGMDAHLAKPVDIELLIETMSRLIVRS